MSSDKSNSDGEFNPLVFKYATIEDYMNSKPLPSVEVDLVFNTDQAELLLDKPVFDIAFIITHKSIITTISDLQKYFQSRFAFTTHCIFLKEITKLKLCIRDLKLHEIRYAIVMYENSRAKDSMDLYILNPIVEVQKNMGLREIEDLVGDDFNNFIEQVQAVKPLLQNNGDTEIPRINEEYRYLLCLLADHRMLSFDELIKLKSYLQKRKMQLESVLSKNNNFFLDRPLEACRQERLKYYIYEPITNDLSITDTYANVAQTSNTNRSAEIIGLPVKYVTGSKNQNLFGNCPMTSNNISVPNYEHKTILKAKYVMMNIVQNLQQIKRVQMKKGQMKIFMYSIHTGVHQREVSKRNDSCQVQYDQSDYYINSKLVNEDVISLSSGSNTPPLDYDLTPITPPTPMLSPAKAEAKRKISETGNPNAQPALKLFIMDTSKDVSNDNSIPIKNSPELLINLLRLLLNIVPLELPHDNALQNILKLYYKEIESKIFVPSLKDVNIDYESCKTNGIDEIIKSIFGIYEVSEEHVVDSQDMSFVWTKYFPDHLSNLNLLILFYKFVKMLIIFRLFNSQMDRLNIVMNTVEKINTIVDFDFKLPIITEKDQHLNYLSGLFHDNYQKHNDLHKMYFDLPHLSSIKPADSRKNLDKTIKQKKIEFVMSPLFNYFVNTINFLHHQMKTEQIQTAYRAVRTLRFCLRQIHPVNSPLTVFNAPKTFDAQNTNIKDLIEELKWLLDEMKYYQCVLFTEKHYDFINCLLDFSYTIENIFTLNSEPHGTKCKDSILPINPKQFIENFSTLEVEVLQYHPETELPYLRNALRDSWSDILEKAFRGIATDTKGKRIIKEVNNLLPSLWGSRTFDEAVVEAAKLNYSEWTRKAQSDPTGWYQSFSQVKFAGVIWLNTNQLPFSKAVEELQKYENMLQNEFLSSSV